MAASISTAQSHAETLSAVVTQDDPRRGLWQLVDSGEADVWLPELPALRLEQDPVHRHKDVLSHTVAVTAQAPNRLRVRLGALLHDIGKPRTRRYVAGNVTFHHHEAVGAKMARRRLQALGYDEPMVADVSRLVFLSGRFKGYTDGWSDAAVRRYCRDAGHLLGDLNDLVRADCTSRNPARVAALHDALDELEARIVQLARDDALAAERPEIDGLVVMEHLGIGPGPVVGEALAFLLELKRSEGELGTDEVLHRLDAWWEARSP
jgi:poly(A) polymerase